MSYSTAIYVLRLLNFFDVFTAINWGKNKLIKRNNENKEK
jgi:hypothetical protein